MERIGISTARLASALKNIFTVHPEALLLAAAVAGLGLGLAGRAAKQAFYNQPPVSGAAVPAENLAQTNNNSTEVKPGSPTSQPASSGAPKTAAGGTAAPKTAASPAAGSSSGSQQTTTGGSPAPPTYDSETSYAPPAFTATRTVDVSTQSAFNTAWTNIQPGDQINVHGVTFTGEVTLANKQLAGWAQISFDSATKFVGVSSAQNLPAVWINNDSHIRFYGGDISDSASGGQAGPGILVYDSDNITWWNFVSHDVGRDGLDIFSVNKPNSSLDFKGEVYHWGLNLAWDPHAEKGTGLHGANLGDSNYGMQDSRIALYAHDGAAGAGIEAGGASATDFFKNNTIYIKCQNLTMHAVSQTGGNCLQYWGENVTGNVIKYLEAENLQGRPYETGGMYTGQSLASDTIEYGRASNTNLNLQINDSIPQNVLWDYQFGTVFTDVSPKP